MSDPTPPATGTVHPEATREYHQAGESIEAVLDFYAREAEQLSRTQRFFEHISRVNGQPAFLIGSILFVVSWLIANVFLEVTDRTPFDAYPYHLLHGLVSLAGLLTATLLLIRQERLGGLAEQREHLDLSVTLLTEQKAAKLIELMEELRRDLPNVRNRDDVGAAELKVPMNPELVLATLAEPLVTGRSASPAANASVSPEQADAALTPP